MKAILSLALTLWKIAATHVYEYTVLEVKIDQLVASEAVGWAVSVEPLLESTGPEVWFATDLGFDRIRMGPWSLLAIRSKMHLSLGPNDQMVMKILERDWQVTGISEWPVVLDVDVASWVTSSRLMLEDKAVELASNGIPFNFTKSDIELGSLPMSFFEDAWSMDTVREHNSRLMVNCDELERRRNTEGLSVKLGDVSIPIREMAYMDAELSQLR